MENSNIEWTDHTWNPWIGCTKVDKLCINCYAEARDIRFEDGKHWGKGAPRQRTSASNWREPYRWNRAHTDALRKWAGGPDPAPEMPRVFCASLADWLDDEVPIEWLAEMLKTVMECRNLTWLLLTKRPQNWAPRVECVLKYIEALPDWDADPLHPLLPLRNWLADWFVLRKAPENVWMGTSVGDQASADTRIPQLLSIPAKIRFLSCEPLLGPVEFSNVTNRADCVAVLGKPALEGIHWVIAGGESGKNARPMHPDWARSLQRQCAAVKVPFFFKQWGEWAPVGEEPWTGCPAEGDMILGMSGGCVTTSPTTTHQLIGRQALVRKFGKKVAGNRLDGREWKEFPA